MGIRVGGCAMNSSDPKQPEQQKAIQPTLPRPRLLPGIQYIRGFAALYVVIFHINGDFHYPFFAHGDLGVQLFFVVSGFIITYIHRNDRGLNRLKIFVGRRFFRIYPIYWAALIPVLLIFFALPDKGLAWHRDPVNIVQNVLLLQDPHKSILGVAWSLVYEIMFYAIFGLWVIGLRYSLWWLLLLWGGFIGIVHWWLPNLSGWIFIDSYNVYFLAGCVLGLLYPTIQRRVTLCPFLIGLGIFVVTPFVFDTFWAILAASILLCLVAILYQPQHPNRIGLLLGDASYSIYLTHLTIVAIVTTFFHTPWIIVPLFALCVAVGLAFYYGLENRLQHWLAQQRQHHVNAAVTLHPKPFQ